MPRRRHPLIDLLIRALQVPGDEGLLKEVAARGAAMQLILARADKATLDAIQRSFIDASWTSMCLEAVAANEKESLVDHRIRETLVRMQHEEESRIAELFRDSLMRGLPATLLNLAPWFKGCPMASAGSRREYILRSGWRAKPYSDQLATYTLTAMNFFEAAVAIGRLADRLVEDTPEPPIQIPVEQTAIEIAAFSQIALMTATRLSSWLLAVSRLKPFVIPFYRAQQSHKAIKKLTPAIIASKGRFRLTPDVPTTDLYDLWSATGSKWFGQSDAGALVGRYVEREESETFHIRRIQTGKRLHY